MALLLFWTETFDTAQSDIYLFNNDQRSSLLSLTQPGDVLIYESQVICSGCVEYLSPLVRKVQTDQNIYLLSAATSNQAMRYRLNDWGKYLHFLPKGLPYDSISLSLSAQSPLIILRDHSRFRIYDHKFLFGHSTKLQNSAVRQFLKDYKSISK